MPKSIADLDQEYLNRTNRLNENLVQDSMVGHGVLVAPAAGIKIAEVVVPWDDAYSLKSYARYGSTGDKVDNMGLYVNNTLVVPLPAVGLANMNVVPLAVKRNLKAGDAVSVRAITAAGALTVYIATLVIDRI